MTEDEAKGMAQTIGAAIQLAWSQHRDLPPIEMTDAEMAYLGRAALNSMLAAAGRGGGE